MKNTLTFIQHRTSWLTILGLLAATCLMLFLMNGTELPFSTLFAKSLSPWLPEWLFIDDATQYEGYTKNILIVVFTLHLVGYIN